MIVEMKSRNDEAAEGVFSESRSPKSGGKEAEEC